MGLQIGPFSMKAKVKGSISSHKENTRKSDNSAKYHVQVRATQGEMPEGLSRVLISSIRRSTPQVSRKLRQQEHRARTLYS